MPVIWLCVGAAIGFFLGAAFNPVAGLILAIVGGIVGLLISLIVAFFQQKGLNSEQSRFNGVLLKDIARQTQKLLDLEKEIAALKKGELHKGEPDEAEPLAQEATVEAAMAENAQASADGHADIAAQFNGVGEEEKPILVSSQEIAEEAGDAEHRQTAANDDIDVCLADRGGEEKPAAAVAQEVAGQAVIAEDIHGAADDYADIEVRFEGRGRKKKPASVPVPEPVAFAQKDRDEQARPHPSAPKEIKPEEPDFVDIALQRFKTWLLGGNPILRVGGAILILGLAFLLRYAAQHTTVPIELRYAGVAFAGLALTGFGWFLRSKKAAYALVLQGLGVSVFYMTTFAALKFEGLVSPGMGFAVLVVVTAATIVLALLQNSLSLAITASLGGFAAPVLVSTGGGSYIGLFSYFALLDVAILIIAWFRAWRPLNIIGFLGTFSIGLAWGTRSYEPALYAGTQAFLIFFFLLFVAVSLLFARRQLLTLMEKRRNISLMKAARRTHYVDGTLFFGVPLVGFGLQYAIIEHIPFGTAYSALALGVFYIGLALVVLRRACGALQLLFETCLVLGLIFASLAVPLGFDAEWTSAIWAVEAAGVYWLSVRQNRLVARCLALLVQAGAVLSWLETLEKGSDTVLSGSVLGGILLGGSLLFTWWQVRQAKEGVLRVWESGVRPLLVLGAIAAWLFLPALLLNDIYTPVALTVLAMLFWIAGLHYREVAVRCLVLLVLAGVAINWLATFETGFETVLSGNRPVGALLGLSLLFIWWRTQRTERKRLQLWETAVAPLLVGIGTAVWLFLPALLLNYTYAPIAMTIAATLFLIIGLYLKEVVPVATAAAFHIGAGLIYLADPLEIFEFAPLAVLSVSLLVSALFVYTMGKEWPDFYRRLCDGLAGYMVLSWLAAVTLTLDYEGAGLVYVQGVLALSIAAVIVWTVLARQFKWTLLGCIALAFTPYALMLLALVYGNFWLVRFPVLSTDIADIAASAYQPFAQWGWIVWPLTVAAHLAGLFYLVQIAPAPMLRVARVAGAWLVVGLIALVCGGVLIDLAGAFNAWRWLGWIFGPMLYLVFVAKVDKIWPLSADPAAYRRIAAVPVAVCLFGWVWLANIINDGSAEPLFYIAFLNPLDIGLLLSVAVLWLWQEREPDLLGSPMNRRAILAVFGATVFAILTAIVLRTTHHWAGIDWRFATLAASGTVQAALSIAWTVMALAAMLFGNKRKQRLLWICGASLAGVVVVKLLLIDMSNTGTLERIVSFIGVGVVLLIIGYFAPLPPRERQDMSEGQKQKESMA